MRQRMEGFGDAQVRVGAHAGFAIHRHRDHARDVGLEGERHQIEHQLEMLGDVVRRADRRIRNRQRDCCPAFAAICTRRSISRTESR